MSSAIDKVINEIKPTLRQIAPHTFWFTIITGAFNALIGASIMSSTVLYTLRLVGVIPMFGWGVIFFVLGVLMLASLLQKNWNLTRGLHIFGVAVMATWWLELMTVIVSGRPPFVLYIWSYMLFLQVIICIYFTPRVGSD